MDWGGRRLLLLTTCLLLPGLATSLSGRGECRVDFCSEMYQESLEEKKIQNPESSVDFCTVLREYNDCMRKLLGRDCRGNFLYHTSITSVKSMLSEYNCTALIGPDRGPPPPSPPRPSIIPVLPANIIPQPPPATRPCTFHGRLKFRYCGLFGDPHLKTFDNRYQTCRVQGAWPLINNPYVAVQVTNEPVSESSAATVTTKVTVIVKGRGTMCTKEKTYVATSDQPLPGGFEDGTNTSGPNQSVTVNLYEVDAEHQVAEIHLKYIETTLVVRQVGKYLAFAAQLPEEVASMDGEDLQLCATGCPASERLDLAAEHGEALPWEEALKRCQQSDGLSNDIRNQLTDHYLDWCVFDVMTTGETEAKHFTAAAHSAQADVLRFEPSSLSNRTTTKLRPRDLSGDRYRHGAASPRGEVMRILMCASVLTWWCVFKCGW